MVGRHSGEKQMARPISTASINTLLLELIHASQIGKAFTLLANHRFPQEVTTHALSVLSSIMVQRSLPHKDITNLVRQLVVAGGANLHYRHEQCLRYAVRANNFHLVQYLLIAGADIHANDDEALQTAVKKNSLSLVRYLIRKGAAVNANKSLAMRTAVLQRNTEMIRLLLDSGAKDTALVRRYYLSPQEKVAFADFFVTFCASVNESDEKQLAVLKGALIHAEIIPADDMKTIEYIRHATKSQLCNWMKVQVFLQGTDCSRLDPVTQLPVSQIPLIYLWTSKNSQTGEKRCFDIFALYQYVQKSKQSTTRFTTEELAQIEKVYVARMRLFWQMQSVL